MARSRRSTWKNWTGDQRCSPAAIERPRSREDVVAAVRRAEVEGRTVKVAGSGHSFTDIACTDGVMLDLGGIDSILDVDPGSGLVRTQPGVVLRELNERLWDRGLAIENLGDIDRQTLAGSISTATHGTGRRYTNISAQLEAIEMVLADGSVLECSESIEPEVFRAARVGLGALGAVTAITVRCVPSFTLRRVDQPRPLTDTLERLDEHACSHDHFEFYVFPHTDIALCRETERTDEPARPAPRWKEYARDVVLENYAMDLAARAGRRFPSGIPRFARAIAGQMGRAVKVDRSHRVFASKRLIRFTEMEYAIPREHGAEAVRRVLDAIDRREFDVGFPIEVRFVAADDAYLSPSSGRDTCYVAVHMYRGMEWERYFRTVESIMNDYGGRPHWGKRHFQTAATLAPRYPDWEAFQRVRARLDPNGRFANAYTDRVLGPPSGSVGT